VLTIRIEYPLHLEYMENDDWEWNYQLDIDELEYPPIVGL
jgi:hypothetical protein